MELRKKPYSVGEFFMEIAKCAGLSKEKMIDYYLGAREDIPITQTEFDIISTLSYGGSEGIYVDIYCRGKINDFSDYKELTHIGTIKTLHEDDEAMTEMGAISGRIVAVGTSFLRKNSLNFTFEDSYCIVPDKAAFKLYIKDIEEARKAFEKHGGTVYNLRSRTKVYF